MTANNIILRKVFSDSAFVCDCENGILSNLIGTFKIIEGTSYYIRGSSSNTKIHDETTDAVYTGNIKDYLILEMIDNVFRTLYDNGIDIYNILPDNFWTKAISPSDIILLKNAYKYVEHLIPFNIFVSFTHIAVIHDCYKLFLMYNYVKGKEDEIIDKYHSKNLGYHMWFEDIYNNLNDAEQDLIEPYISNRDKSCFDQINLHYLAGKVYMRQIYNRSPFNSKHIVFDDQNFVNFNEVLLNIVKMNVDQFGKDFVETEETHEEDFEKIFILIEKF